VTRLRDWLPFGRVPEMSPDVLEADRIADRIQILDVRTAAEFRRSRIPEARHLPIQHFSSRALQDAGLDFDRPVVTICLSAHRSIPAVRRLRALGHDAFQLRGGMRAWWRAGMPTESGP
jgi:rhodanese-related sulfurtransferase